MARMDAVFKALADPTRRALLDRLGERNGQTLAELCEGLEIARQSVSKHLAVLESAGVVTTRWRGREKLHFLDAAPINAIADRWLSRFDRRRAEALADLKTTLEETTMSELDFVYTTYIRTTPDALWTALTDPAFTSRYWGAELRSDWVTGAPLAFTWDGVTMTDPRQQVLDADPPRRLSYTWHAITDEFAQLMPADEAELVARMATEPLSHVTFEIEEVGESVRLTVTHGGFEPGSEIREGISGGWPEILSSLKTLLETGDPLPR
jgi:uncharacterized protein YndB with AHSA1/START domain/DNA-binding MarR family transcriptional regulator